MRTEEEIYDERLDLLGYGGQPVGYSYMLLGHLYADTDALRGYIRYANRHGYAIGVEYDERKTDCIDALVFYDRLGNVAKKIRKENM